MIAMFQVVFSISWFRFLNNRLPVAEYGVSFLRSRGYLTCRGAGSPMALVQTKESFLMKPGHFQSCWTVFFRSIEGSERVNQLTD